MSGLRQCALFAVWAVALACAGVALVATLDAEPAGAFDAWQHDGATACVCHASGTPTDAACTACRSLSTRVGLSAISWNRNVTRCRS